MTFGPGRHRMVPTSVASVTIAFEAYASFISLGARADRGCCLRRRDWKFGKPRRWRRWVPREYAQQMPRLRAARCIGLGRVVQRHHCDVHGARGLHHLAGQQVGPMRTSVSVGLRLPGVAHLSERRVRSMLDVRGGPTVPLGHVAQRISVLFEYRLRSRRLLRQRQLQRDPSLYGMFGRLQDVQFEYAMLGG